MPWLPQSDISYSVITLRTEAIEHDTYVIFEKVMEYMWDWYFTSPPPINMKNRLKSEELSANSPQSFNEKNDIVICDLVSNAAKRLQNMWDNILQLYNKVLYDHLVSLNILPTTFGINWTKLLFTRQFPDYFHLWDAIIVSKFTWVWQVFKLWYNWAISLIAKLN